MTVDRAIALALLLAICGCDRLGKSIPTPPPVLKKTATAPAAQQVVSELPQIEPATSDTADPPELAEQSPPSEKPAPDPATAALAADDDLLLYEDSFIDVAGSIRRRVEGMNKPAEGGPGKRTIYTFQAQAEDGPLTLRIVEDNTTPGPDGEPGVLSLGWEEIPKKLHYSGFVYLGANAKRMELPKLKAARTASDLSGLRLRFRYRGVNTTSETPVKLQVNCRLEPLLDDSFNRRIDFGVLVATDEWQSFDLALADGKNQEAFLKMLAEDNPPAFKIVWGQSHPIEHYRAGDTLLIDDIRVISVPVAAQ